MGSRPVLSVLVAATLLGGGPDAAVAQRRLAFTLPGMERVRVVANQPYRSLVGSADTVMYGNELRFDVFLPIGTANLPRPAVLFVHGGLVPDTQRVSPKDDLPAYREWGRLVAAAGYVGITFSHRLTTQDNVDVAAGDVRALLDAVHRRAAEWQLDTQRMCVAVFSAGGPLGSVFMQDARTVRCIALYYPFLDMEHARTLSAFRGAHSPERAAELDAYSPRGRVLALGGAVPPLLLARAGRDVIPGINASIDRFVQAALWTNAPLDLYVHPTGRHGFDMTDVPDVRAAAILEATIDFFRRHLER